jgi:GH35 family endo-1,4-beta-xylanase
LLYHPLFWPSQHQWWFSVIELSAMDLKAQKREFITLYFFL